MTNYNDFTIFGWMINELGLSGSDLIVYAYFYDLSKNKSLLVTDFDVINATDCLRRLFDTLFSFDAYDLDYVITKLISTGHFVEIGEPDFAFRVVLPEEYKEN